MIPSSRRSAGDTLGPGPAARPSRNELVGFLERVGDDYAVESAIEDASALGFHFRLTWIDPTTAYVQAWEHPAAIASNRALDCHAAPTEACLFRLYEFRRESTGAPPFVFVVGVTGRSVNYEIWCNR